jgi:RNA polymerase sigma factor (sigma-70 family)
VVAILRSARSERPHPRLDEVLQGFRRQWVAIAHRRYPFLRDELEDAVQTSLMKLLSPDHLESLRDVARVEAWGRGIFVNTVLDLVRHHRRRERDRLYLGDRDGDPEDVLREGLPSHQPTPEEVLARRERLDIVVRCVERSRVARLKFVEDLPEKEIAARAGLSRDGVAGQLKRLRKGLRDALEDS